MTKRILLIAATTGYQTRSFAEAAERLGYDVQLATDRCHQMDDPWGDRAIALRFQEPSKAAEAIAAHGSRIDGIVAVGDRPAEIAALTAALLRLPGNPPTAVAACRNKHRSRERFQDAGLLVPRHRLIPLTDSAAAADRYPCVLKPLGLSASRGVIRANNPAQFNQALKRIRAILESPDIARMHEEQDRFIQVEDFIEGREFALEGILTRGCLDTLAIFDKPDPLNGPYFEETLYITPSRESSTTQAAMIDATMRAVAALGLTHGPVHAEMRVNETGVWMLEVAARPIGGLCAQVLRFDDGGGLEERIIRHAAGDPQGSSTLAALSRGVMMIPIPREGVYVDVAGAESARMVKCIDDVIITAKAGQKLVPLPEGSSYLGFIFAAGDGPAQVESALREAHAQLKFEIASTLPVVR